MPKPLKAHYWRAEGTGELTSRWFNPVCDTTVRRHITDFEKDGRTPQPDTDSDKCPDCAAIMAEVEKIIRLREARR